MKKPVIFILLNRSAIAFSLCAMVSLWSANSSADEPGSDDPMLPQPVTARHFEALLEYSPFTRSLNLSDSILLTGVAEIDGKQVATLFNKETRESYVVSDSPNTQGWKMVEIERNQDLEQVSASISVDGGEIVTVRFSEGQLKPGEGKPAATAVPATPRGIDRRPRGTDEQRRKWHEWVKNRMSKMSEAQRRRVGEIMAQKKKENPNMSSRQGGEVYVKILDYVEANHK